MLVATLVAALGFVAVAVGTRRYGLRFGGTIVVGVLAVYTLKNFTTLPIFIGSTAVAYGALAVVKRYTLAYGRDEFIVAILAGSLVPSAVYVGAFLLPGPVELALYRSVFVGSLLSGIAAFNLHQLRPEHRLRDVGGLAAIYLGLLALGAALVGPSTRFLAEYTPLVLFARTSDIAVLRGAVVEGFVDPAFVARPVVIGLYALALGLSEAVRQAFGVRVGTVALGLVAVYTVSTWRLLALTLVTLAVVTVLVTAIHRGVILYGRALLSTSAALGVVVAIPVAALLGVSAGISSLFAGVVAGLGGYYVHLTPPTERRQQVAVAVAVFLPLVVLVRAVVPPGPEGIPQALGVAEVAGGLLVAAVALAVALHYRVEQPDDEAVLAASTLGEGGS
ncbi:poly-gamma-glutamate biosynthesis protein PgsC/CapC [Haloglomus litoreum]|uniref:poly-gamma-glutamate biosynthesis protein PgsC/CapC n=1 Tax=Haloglomus litoreum TaxID=3034026 RepID=UPI0023E8C192|nr:poly-gamma-glutamate biosynthesis protein PgsC/CapC [Haloglomus sp. DT116]